MNRRNVPYFNRTPDILPLGDIGLINAISLIRRSECKSPRKLMNLVKNGLRGVRWLLGIYGVVLIP